MKIKKIHSLFKIVIVIGLACNFLCLTCRQALYGQTNLSTSEKQMAGDSLSLAKIIGIVVQNHPSVKEAEEAMKATDANIGLAKSGYYPVVDASASYARIGPVQELTFPGFGTFQLYPADNFDANINFYQTVYDFGKTSKNIDLANESKNIYKQTIEQVKQKLASTVTLIYYAVVYLQEAIIINKEQLKTLQEHLSFVEKKQETGSATQYEILSTKVKISNVESVGIDLQTVLRNHITELNVLMGQPKNNNFNVKEELGAKIPQMPEDSLLSYAFEHRDEVKIAREKTTLAELKYKVVKAQDKPSLNFHLAAGGKNGYIPELNTIKANYVAALGLKVPIFDGTRSKYNQSLAKSTITMTEFETDLAKKNITTDVSENSENIKAALRKIEHFKLQLNQSQEAFNLAQANFRAGSITNLDLLDATTAISESSLLLLKSRIEYIADIYKLKVAIGERLY